MNAQFDLFAVEVSEGEEPTLEAEDCDFYFADELAECIQALLSGDEQDRALTPSAAHMARETVRRLRPQLAADILRAYSAVLGNIDGLRGWVAAFVTALEALGRETQRPA